MTEPDTIGNLKSAIKAALEADGCTQTDLADYLGLSQKHVSQVLTGKATGDLRMLVRMAAAVGLDLVASPSGADTPPAV
jgi:transcriptional regulator with XRE-family HTH domain